MWRISVLAASGLSTMLFVAGPADAAAMIRHSSHESPILHRAHSVGEAEESLYRRGYYDIRLERTSLPYSFSACKRGVRYHIHVNYYGDLVQVDEVGPCRRSYDEGAYYGRRPYYDRYRGYHRRDY